MAVYQAVLEHVAQLLAGRVRDELREDRGLALDSLQEADRRLGRGDADDFSWHLDAGWLAKALDALYNERKPAPKSQTV